MSATVVVEEKTALLGKMFTRVIGAANQLLRERDDEIGQSTEPGEGIGLGFLLDGAYLRVDLSKHLDDRMAAVRFWFKRGVGDKADVFWLEYSFKEECFILFALSSGMYDDTEYCRYLPGAGSAVFGRGIGPKRQRRALQILSVMEERLTDLLPPREE